MLAGLRSSTEIGLVARGRLGRFRALDVSSKLVGRLGRMIDPGAAARALLVDGVLSSVIRSVKG